MSGRSLLEDRLFGDGFFTGTIAAEDGTLCESVEFRWGLDVYHATNMVELLIQLDGLEKGWVAWHLSRWHAAIEIKKGDDALLKWIGEQDEERDSLVDGDWEID